MPQTIRQKTREKTEDDLLDQATMQLLRAIKSHTKKSGGKLSRDKLLKAGYSERFLEKLERA